jgi:beta-glucosidase-like glycosyl hydrolase
MRSTSSSWPNAAPWTRAIASRSASLSGLIVAPLATAAVLASLLLLGPEASAVALTPREKAALLVVSGLPALPGVGGVFVRPWDRDEPRPPGAIVFVDQEGGLVKGFRELPPAKAAAEFRSAEEALAAGRATGRALRRKGVRGDFAPVLDLPDGPLGSRHFRNPAFGVAFARGLGEAGVAACAKHFPGLGTAPVSTDDRPSVHARVRQADLAPYRAAIRTGVPCVMVSHAFYRGLGRGRASLDPAAYRLLRSLGFEGVAITDSLNFVRSAPVERWAPRAIRAGADLLLFSHPDYARRAIDALVPLARRGELDVHVERVLRFRARYRWRRRRPAARTAGSARRASGCRASGRRA